MPKIIVNFLNGTGNDRLLLMVKPGVLLKDWKHQVEKAYEATFQTRVTIKAFLEPEFLPDEVALQLDEDAAELLDGMKSVAAKLASRNEAVARAPRPPTFKQRVASPEEEDASLDESEDVEADDDIEGGYDDMHDAEDEDDDLELEPLKDGDDDLELEPLEEEPNKGDSFSEENVETNAEDELRRAKGRSRGKGKAKAKGKSNAKAKANSKGRGKGKNEELPAAPAAFVAPTKEKLEEVVHEEMQKAANLVEMNEDAIKALGTRSGHNVRMQQMLREKDPKSEEGEGPTPEQEEFIANLRPILESYGYKDADIYDLLQRCNFDFAAVQESIDYITSGTGEENTWVTRVARKHHREMVLRDLKRLEINYLESSFGSLLTDLRKEKEQLQEPERTPEGSPSLKCIHPARRKKESRMRPAEKLELLRKQWLKEAGDLMEENQGDKEKQKEEEKSVAKMDRAELRNLLLRMKPLTTTPVDVYEATAHRAVKEYVKFNPVVFTDVADITFFQLNTLRDQDSKELRNAPTSERYAAKPFFDVLGNILPDHMGDMSPVCLAYMLQTFQQSGHATTFIFHEAARHFEAKVQELDRDSLGMITRVYAQARIPHPKLFYKIAMDVLRRNKSKEGPHSLSPKTIQDLFFGFSRAQVHHADMFESLMERAVLFFDARPDQQYLDDSMCASVRTSTGRKISAQPFKMQGILGMAQAQVQLNIVDKEFFDDMAAYMIRFLRSGPVTADRFMGDPKITLVQIATAYARAGCYRNDFFDAIRDAAFRRKDDMGNLKMQELWKAVQMQKKDEVKAERARSAPPARQRGAMGRAVIEHAPPPPRASRRERSLDARGRMEKNEDEEQETQPEKKQESSDSEDSDAAVISTTRKFIPTAVIEASDFRAQNGQAKGNKKKHYSDNPVDIKSASTKAKERKLASRGKTGGFK